MFGIGKSVAGHLAGAAGQVAHSIGGVSTKAANALIVGEANTATTTIAPLTTQAPPENQGTWQLIGSAMESVSSSLLRWAGPVLTDVALVSLAFAACELAAGAGRHAPALRCGCTGRATLTGRLLHDIVSQWLNGVGLLVALWMLSIILAPELRHAAEFANAHAGMPLLSVAVALGLLCVAASLHQAMVLSRLPCTPCAMRAYYAVPQEHFSPLSRFGVPAKKSVARWSLEMLSLAGSGLAIVGGACLGAVEAPLVSWAVGSTYTSFIAVCWLLPLLPWQLVADHLAWFLPGPLRWLARAHAGVLLCVALAAGLLVVWLLLAVSRRCIEVAEKNAQVTPSGDLEIFEDAGVRGIDELPPGSFPPL